MDKTYVEECRLVNDEFKDNDSKQKILNIIGKQPRFDVTVIR
jgi:hypothetical protein